MCGGVNLDAVVRKRSGGCVCWHVLFEIMLVDSNVPPGCDCQSGNSQLPAAIACDPSKGCDRVSQIPGPAGTPINFGEEKMVTLFPFHVRCGCDSQILVTQTPTARRWKKEWAL